MPPPVAPRTRPSAPSPSASSSPTSTRRTSCAPRRSCARSSVTFRSRFRIEWPPSGASTSAPRPPCSTRTRDRPCAATSSASSASWTSADWTSPLHVMQSSGGVVTARSARERPVQTLLSGPVGGSMGLVALARLLDRPNLIGVDMGGTSFDVSLVIDGRPEITTETSLEGLPLLMPIVNIHTVGAGGGSLAYEEGGGLRVGPQSAGADPGPACYGRGGTPADRHRCESRPRPDRSRRRSPAAGCRSTPLPPERAVAGLAREALARAAPARRGDPRRDQREDGAGDPDADRGPGNRAA